MLKNKSLKNVLTHRKAEVSFKASSLSPLKGVQCFLTFGISVFLVVSLCSTPEGAIREGDYLPISLLFFFILLGSLLLCYKATSSPTKQTSNCSLLQESFSPSITIKRILYLPIVADVSLGCYVLLITISTLKVLLFHTGDIRLALNGYWVFVTPALLYFFLRFFYILISEQVVLNLCFIVAACTVAESVYATYSYTVINPRLRAAYSSNPEKMLADNGMVLEKDSRERLLFEKRLLESVEPTGTYGLANTLAGFLAPFFVLGIIGFPWRRILRSAIVTKGRNRFLIWTRLLLFSSALFSVGVTVLTTKSRSAFLAIIAGLIVWSGIRIVLFSHSCFSQIRYYTKTLICLFFFGTPVLIGAFAIGILDLNVITEAGKSLSYRLDYWIATWRMIIDHPMLGVGPGEFQNTYPHYILPTASEFIADPHNFLFEQGALFGIPAVCAFFFFLLITIVSSIRHLILNKNEPNVFTKVNMSCSIPPNLLLTAFWGAFAGILLTFLLSFFQSVPVPLTFYFIVLVCLLLVFFILLGRFTVNLPVVSTMAIIACITTLLVNLCAAGGISYAPISTTLFLLCAVLNNRIAMSTDDLSTPQYLTALPVSVGHTPRSLLIAIFVTLSILTVFYTTSFKPRLNAFIFELRFNTNPDHFVSIFRRGRIDEIDSSSVVVVSRYYCWTVSEFAKHPNPENKQRWKEARQKILSVSPNSSTISESCGDFDMELYKKKPNLSEILDSAIDFYQMSVNKSPTDISKRVKLVRSLRLAGKYSESCQHREIALELDRNNPHEDRKLTPQEREELTL